MNTYYIASLLPPLEIGHIPTLHYAELRGLLKQNLSPKDYAQVEALQRLVDCYNMRAIWSGAEFEPRGNYSKNELAQVLTLAVPVPDYIADFLQTYVNDAERLNHFPELISRYFQAEIARQSGFVKRYLMFEREWRLVMIGFRAKATHRDVMVELQHEDPTDDLVAQIIAQKDTPFYEPPFEYSLLKPLFEAHLHEPIELSRALAAYRFKCIGELAEGPFFTLERVLAYLMQLLIVERELELDQQKGKSVIERLMKEAKE